MMTMKMMMMIRRIEDNKRRLNKKMITRYSLLDHEFYLNFKLKINNNKLQMILKVKLYIDNAMPINPINKNIEVRTQFPPHP